MQETNSFREIKYNRLVVILVAIQILLIIFWVSRQGSLYWDAYYTLERAHYVASSNGGPRYINDDPGYTLNEWMDSEYVRDTLYVDYDESVFKDSPQYVLNKLIKEPYFVLLNAVEAVFSPGKLSKWPGVGLNIVFFIITQFVLWKMVKRMSGSEKTAILTIVLYGFSGMAFSMATYVRFYVFATMLLALFVYLHVIMWGLQSSKWYFVIGCELLSLICAYFSMSIAQLTLFFFAIYIFLYNIALLVKHNYLKFALYFGPVLCGSIYYLAVNTDYLTMLFNPTEAFKYVPGPALWVLDSYMTLTPMTLLDRAAHMFLYMGKYGFGFWPVFLLFCIIAVTLMARIGMKKLFSSAIEWVTFISFVLFMIVSACLRLYVQTRYTSYVYPLLAWIVAFFLLRLVEISRRAFYTKLLAVIIVMAVIFSSVSGLRIDCIFSQDRAAIDRIRNSGIRDVVVIQQNVHNYDAETMYDATANIPENSRMMPLYYKDLNSISEELPDEILLINRKGIEIVDDFDRQGYNLEWQEITYCYVYSYMKRR